MTSEAEYDDEGVALPGTTAISVVSLGMWGEGGRPLPTVHSAVCDTCEDWASHLWVATSTEVTDADDLFDRRVKRRTETIVYTCPKHVEEIADQLMSEADWGIANWYEPSDLAQKVHRFMRHA